MSGVPQIDAHQHFWQISRGDYDWMTDEVALIRRDILPVDLVSHLEGAGILGTVVVQAAATLAETEFLLSLAEQTPFIKGVVGWVDLESPDAPMVMETLRENAAFKGIRPMLQDIEDSDWVGQPRVIQNLSAAAQLGLRFDALVTPRHLRVLAGVAQAIPDLPIVIDHCAKPIIAGGTDPGQVWRQDMSGLAKLPNVWCKVSGLANEAGATWSVEGLRPVVSHVLRAFGPDRVMWGSDWPVLNLVGDYRRWRDASRDLLSGLSGPEQEAVFGGNAARFYGLTV